MKKKMFEELLGSIREAGEILRAQKKRSRRIVIGSSGVRAIRERTSLSQSEFANLIGVSVKDTAELGTGPASSHRTRSCVVEDHFTRATTGVKAIHQR
jgi:hypothetical protein